MQIRTIRFFKPPEAEMALNVHTVGYNFQKKMSRPDGFSAHQLLFARNGQGKLRLGDQDQEEFSFGPMQYIVLPPDLPHEYYPVFNEPWEVGYVSFQGSGVADIFAHFQIRLSVPYNVPNMHSVWHTLEAMWKIGDTNDEGTEWEAVRLLYGLLLDLNRMQALGAERYSRTVALKDKEAGRGVAEQAANYLNEHFNENIMLSNVASSLGYSHQHLNRLFRESHGVSMHQYVQRIRLDKAISYMNERENITVKEAASLVGMETSYFIRHFRKIIGMTPDQYRRNRG